MSSHNPISVLVLDDNPACVDLLMHALAQPGIEILGSVNPADALEIFSRRLPRIVFTDLVMPEMSGLTVLDRIMALDPTTDVILMTAHESTEAAVEAMKRGAADYLTKPVAMAPLRARIAVLVEDAKGVECQTQDGREIGERTEIPGIIGHSPPMRRMFSRLRRVAPYYRTVLITGETGTGKDLMARALHDLSPVGRSGRYVVLNCSAVVEELFESELFGHVRGAFTGAVQDKPGLIEHAHGGTLFLDEIGDMPLATQAKLLRVLQNREVQRVGSLTTSKVEVRIIAATNHDLRAAVGAARFRMDLYYRLSMIEVEAPRLADRKDDLPLLERHFIAEFAAQYRKEIRGLTARARSRLMQHSWPGNVRELQNVLGHAAMMSASDTIDLTDLPVYLRSEAVHPAALAMQTPDTLEDAERLLLARTLAAAEGNQSRAARLLHMGRDAFRYKVKKHNLQPFDTDRVSAAGAG